MATHETGHPKRFRKVYYAQYTSGINQRFPVIRIGGKYLARLNFEIGDSIEVSYEKERITITKVPPETKEPTLF